MAGAKSDSLLMAALQYVDVPDYAAILFRRTYADLALPGALMDRARDWLSGKALHWSHETKTWRFPSGATLSFGYLQAPGDERRYKSAEFQYVGIDELTELKLADGIDNPYLFLFSRLRRPSSGPLSQVPLRMRSASNPGGPGHAWVKKRFLPQEFFAATEEEQFSRVWYQGDRAFVPARLEDNPSIGIEYEQSLAKLDPITRAQMRHGDWKAHAGGRFQPGWFRHYQDFGELWVLDDGTKVVKHSLARVVCVDPANRKTKTSKYTAMVVCGDAGNDRVMVLDVVRDQFNLDQVIPQLNTLCGRWHPEWVGIEANGFQIALVNQARDGQRYRNIPTVRELYPTAHGGSAALGKSKLARATPAILRAEHRQVYLPEDAPWLEDFVAELCLFTGDDKLDSYSDQVDAFAYIVLGLDRFGSSPAGMPMVLGSM